jgi:hypothetical protein
MLQILTLAVLALAAIYPAVDASGCTDIGLRATPNSGGFSFWACGAGSASTMNGSASAYSAQVSTSQNTASQQPSRTAIFTHKHTRARTHPPYTLTHICVWHPMLNSICPPFLAPRLHQFFPQVYVNSVNNDMYHIEYYVCQGNNSNADLGCVNNQWKVWPGKVYSGNFREHECK